MLMRFHPSHLSHTFSSSLFYTSPFSLIHSFHLLFSPSRTLTLHLRNSAFSDGRWCLIATWFSLCCHLCLFALLNPLPSFQSSLPLLLSNLPPNPCSFGPLPPPSSFTHLLVSSPAKFGHAWQRRRAPAGTSAGWTGSLFSSQVAYIKLHQGLGIPVASHISTSPPPSVYKCLSC